MIRSLAGATLASRERLARRSRAVLTATLVCAGTAAVTTPAFADPAAQARFHDERARKAYEKGKFEDALREFFLEQRLAPNPRIAFNIALCFEQLKRREDAFQFFSEYSASADQDPERRSYSEAALKQLSPKVARLRVTSKPEGAHIFVDEREHGEYGVTPAVIAVAEGTRKVWVELPGHRPAFGSWDAKRGQLVEASLAPKRIVGTLQLTSSAPGKAEVRTPEGQPVAEGDTPLSAELPPGSYEVMVNAPGHVAWRGLGAVRPDETSVITVSPEPLPAPTGEMTVTSNLAGALIELDGRPAGFSPTVLGTLPLGKHTLSVKRDGVLPWSGDVDVSSDQRAWVTVTLEEPPVTTRSSATWVAGGVGVAALLGGGFFSYLAAKNHSTFEDAGTNENRARIADRGETYNTTADVLFGTAIVSFAVATALYFGTEQTRGRPSNASVARGDR
jgi:outer membrane receptor for ferrienterochelin and colicins